MIDITFDLETCALCPNAAVMSIGAVVWNRYAEDSPFEEWGGRDEPVYKNFSAHVDLRGMFLDGFSFDKETADWWSRQEPDAKRALLDNDSEDSPCSPIDKVIKDFFDWMSDFEKKWMRTTRWQYGVKGLILTLRSCATFVISIASRYLSVIVIFAITVLSSWRARGLYVKRQEPTLI